MRLQYNMHYAAIGNSSHLYIFISLLI